MAPSLSEDYTHIPESKTNDHTFQVSEENRVFVLQHKGKFAYETRPTPKLPTSRHVLVKIIATGICGSDVHYWQHGRIGPFVVEQPLVLGHESAGIIVQCGSDVKGLKLGDRVAVEPGVPCRSCEFCRGGKYNLCDEMRFAATPPVDGTLATYYTVPEDFCFVLPPNISIEEGALVEPLSIAVHCSRLASVSVGQKVLVMGAGPIGLLCCAVAKALGASVVIATDIVDSRLKFAQRYAATHTYKMQKDLPEVNAGNIMSSCGIPAGAEVVIDATGVAACIAAGVFALKKGGTFVQAGLGAPDIVFSVGEFCSKEASYKSSFRYGPGDYALSIKLLESNRVDLKALITHTFKFESAAEAFASTSRKEGIKTIIYGPDSDAPGVNGSP
ncbi:chaperonin 10-like protein [Leptodontidium sp. MPI-SDFR-AT-0119]|nr:chaperonin 10-like protein [Leptodontidium sp. MPI-SDFR-AT-0119]